LQDIGSASRAGGAFGLDERIDMSRVFNLITAIIASPVLSHDLVAVENAHRIDRCRHDEGFTHQLMRHRIVVAIEADVGRLSHRDLTALLARIGIVRQRQQLFSF